VQERPRSYLINEAIANYIQLHAYQDALVTFNVRDFGTVPARFGIEVMIPREAIGRMRP